MQMVLGAIEKMNDKLDDLKDAVAKYVADTSSRVSVLEEWKRAGENLNMDNRVRALENDRVTQARIDTMASELKAQNSSLKAELVAVQQAQAASKVKDRIYGAIATIALTGLLNLLFGVSEAAALPGDTLLSYIEP